MNSNKTIMISIIVACRNEEKYIEKCILSLLNQIDISGPLEILIIDGESTDKTPSIIDRLSCSDERIKIHKNTLIKKVNAINVGFKKALGTYIAICDAHAEYDSYYLSRCIDILKNDSSVWCAGGPISSVGETEFGKAAAIAMSSRIGIGTAFHRFPNFEGYTNIASFPVFHRDLLDKIGYYDEYFEVNHDDEYCFRIIRAGGKIYLKSSAKSTYYVRNNPRSLFNQYYQYGYWQIAFYKKHKLLRSFRQFVPFLFFLFIFLFMIIGLLLSNLMVAVLLPSIYISILSISSIQIIKNHGLRIGLNFLLAIVFLHFSYALGFLSGAINLKFNINSLSNYFK